MNNRSSKHFTWASKPAPRRSWQDGDIAFLKTSNTFSPRDYDNLIASGYIHEKATCHPVIILKAHSGRAIITPVTAFSSGAENNFLPPWQQVYHRHKSLDDFRAFVGTKRPNNKHGFLKLADPKMQMPKPQASWVYLKHFWTVPYSVLGWFNKAPSLQVSRDCLAQMRQDIKQKYDGQLQDALDRLDVSPVVAPIPASAPEDPAPNYHAAPAMATSSQQAIGKVLMAYSKVVSGTCGTHVTRVASITS